MNAYLQIQGNPFSVFLQHYHTKNPKTLDYSHAFYASSISPKLPVHAL